MSETKDQLQQIMKKDGNDKCADCFKERPSWASVNLGIFICIKCAGVHRSLGTNISQVKSCSLDKWTVEQVMEIQNKGNIKVNSFYERNIPSHFQRPNWSNEADMENFIRQKYINKKWISSIAFNQAQPLQNLQQPQNENSFSPIPSFDLLSIF